MGGVSKILPLSSIAGFIMNICKHEKVA